MTRGVEARVETRVETRVKNRERSRSPAVAARRLRRRHRAADAGYACARRCLIALAAAGVGHAHAEGRAGDPTEAASPWRAGGIAKADVLHGRQIGDSAVGYLGLRADADAAMLFGWRDTALHAELLWTGGGKPNRRLGSTQGISNLEVAEGSARIYATWIEHRVAASDTSVLLGLYDINSEFYVTDASGLLIHPSFGIGIDFSQSGRNGPSIFPNLGLALRAKQPLGADGHYVQAAVVDGVPGDPARPGRTSLRLSRNEGALLVAEAGWQASTDATAGSDAGSGNGNGHWALGAWHYTARSVRLDAGGAERNQGAYALAQGVLVPGPRARTTGFIRAGIANAQVSAVVFACDAGVLIDRPFGEAGPSAITLGVAHARYGGPQRRAQQASGIDASSAETAFEAGMRWQLSRSWAVQPLVQHVLDAGGRRGANDTLVGVRIEVAFGSGQP